MRSTIGPLIVGFFIVTSCFGGVSSNGGDGGPDAAAAAVTFYKDISPILQQNCQKCHQSGGVAPFSLISYDDAKTNAAAIVADTQQHIMPPWGALDTTECKPRYGWRDDLRLSQSTLDTIKAWHDQGDAAGNKADAPTPITIPLENDLPNASSVAPATAFTLKQTSDYFRCFVLDPQITAPGTFITGTNVKPGNRTIVHHALVYAVPGNATFPAPTDGVANQYDCFGGPSVSNPELIAVWAPGTIPYTYPPNVAHPLNVGTKLVMQIHYHPHANATPDPDTTTFQFTTTTTKPTWTVATLLAGNYTNAPDSSGVGLENPPFVIPPDAPKQVFTMDTRYPSSLPPVRLLAVAAHMHLVGYDELITVARANPTQQDPANECLLQEPQWNFNWQRAYEYATDIASLPLLSPGDVVKMRCTYNNTMSNPFLAASLTEAGQKQTHPVTLGETTLDEMCLGAFWLVYPSL